MGDSQSSAGSLDALRVGAPLGSRTAGDLNRRARYDQDRQVLTQSTWTGRQLG